MLVTVKRHNKKVWLFIDGIRHDKYFSHEQRVRLYKNAADSFDQDLENAALRFKDHPYGAFLWLFTSDFIRGEEIGGLVRWHLLKEMLLQLFHDQKFCQLAIETPIPKFLKLLLRINEIPVKVNLFKYVKSFFYGMLLRMFYFFRSFLKNLMFILRKENSHHEGVIADVNKSFAKHRFDSIERIIELFPKIKFFSGQEHKLEGIPEADTVVFRRELTIGIFIKAVLKTIKLSVFVLNNKSQIPPALYSNLSDSFNLLQWHDLIVLQNCIKKYLDKNEIDRIYHVSTLTKPSYRILMSEAARRNIDFTLVASRTLMKSRASERLLKCDVARYNSTALPNHYIFKDQYSTGVFDPYPDLRSKVSIGSRFLNKQTPVISEEKPFAVLILFNHFEEIVFSLLHEIKSAGIDKIIDTIIYRFHPAYKLSNEKMQALFPTNTLVDITGKDYSAIAEYRTIAISGPTTGALDAVQAGTVIIWAPYIWEDGILMDDIMKQLGILCLNSESIRSSVEMLLTDKSSYFIQRDKDGRFVKDNFGSSNLISECIAELNQLSTKQTPHNKV
jgi:hypothetical protein